ncbi:MAG: polysaccharide biosynthesis/export family protein [Chthoniobacteraceae bacterium]
MPRSRFSFTGFFVVLLLAKIAVLAQSTAPRTEAIGRGVGGYPQPGSYPSAERMESVDPDAKLGPGDELTIEIEQDREGAFPRMVSATGEIDVPPYGRVKIAGKTTAEAAAEIKRLLEKDYYYTATIRLSLDRRPRTAVKAGTVTISGEVRAVGSIDLEAGARLTVSQAILKSGGFGPFANKKRVQVTRTEGGVSKQFFVDVNEVLEKGHVEKDVEVRDGDRINVSRAAIIF